MCAYTKFWWLTLFIQKWTFSLFPFFGYCEQWCTNSHLSPCFQSFWVVAFMGHVVMEYNLIPLAPQQANKLRDELLGQGIMIFFGKLVGQEDGRLVSQRTIFPELGFRFLLYQKRTEKSPGSSRTRGEVLISSSLELFICRPGQGVSWELNKVF